METKTKKTTLWALIASFALAATPGHLKSENTPPDKEQADVISLLKKLIATLDRNTDIIEKNTNPEKILHRLMNNGTDRFGAGNENEQVEGNFNPDLCNLIKLIAIKTDHIIYRPTLFEKILKQSDGYLAQYLIITALGIATAVYGSRVFWNYTENELRKPTISAESYKKSKWRRFVNFITWKKEIPRPEMIFNPELKTRLNNLSTEIQATKAGIQKGADLVYPNIILYGEPGTGKTMWAKEFARLSGMNFDFIPAAALFQDGAGLQAINKIFKSAQKSKNGTILFFDEADAFFIDRNSMDPKDPRLGIINAFLTHMGEGSNKFMVIATTNNIKRLDKAMERRFPEAIEMLLPGFNERVATLKLYRDTLLYNKKNKPEFIEKAQKVFSDKKIDILAQETEGFSYDDLGRIVSGTQTKSLQEADRLTTELVNTIVAQFKTKKAVFKKDTQEI